MRWLKWGIPAIGVFPAGLLVVIAIAIAPDDDTQGFRIRAELVKASLTFAVAIFTGAVVSFLIPEYGRRVDARKDHALERRRLVGELRDVHHAVTTAALRIKAHRTVRTYGSEIRDIIMPKVAQLGGVISDVEAAQKAQNFSEDDAQAIGKQVGQAKSYLERLTNEFKDKYLPASLFQEACYKWRQHHVGKFANGDTPPTSEDLLKTSVADERVWGYIAGKEGNDEFRFPRLAVLLELQGAGADKSDRHSTQFSEPIRNAMNIIEGVGAIERMSEGAGRRTSRRRGRRVASSTR